MKLVLINKTEAVQMLGKKWDRPANSDQATVNIQLHKAFYVPEKWIGKRKGVKVTRKKFKKQKTYRAYPTDEELKERLARMQGLSGNQMDAKLQRTEAREISQGKTRSEYEDKAGKRKRV